MTLYVHFLGFQNILNIVIAGNGNGNGNGRDGNNNGHSRTPLVKTSGRQRLIAEWAIKWLGLEMVSRDEFELDWTTGTSKIIIAIHPVTLTSVEGDQGLGRARSKAELGVGCGRGSPPPAVRVRRYHPRKILENSDAKSCILVSTCCENSCF